MAANGISTLPTKEERQKAKLTLAAKKRKVTGRNDLYDLSKLPTTYSGNTVRNNSNPSGLEATRPWRSDKSWRDYGYSSSSPQLILDFENEVFIGSNGHELIDAVDVTMTSPVTVMDSDGNLKWSAHNILTHSEDLTDVKWA